MYPAVAAALFTPQPARTEQSSTVPQWTLKFPRRLYSEFHFLAFWFILFFSPLFSLFFLLWSAFFVPCLNFGKELLLQMEVEVRQNGWSKWLKKGEKLWIIMACNDWGNALNKVPINDCYSCQGSHKEWVVYIRVNRNSVHFQSDLKRISIWNSL